MNERHGWHHQLYRSRPMQSLRKKLIRIDVRAVEWSWSTSKFDTVRLSSSSFADRSCVKGLDKLGMISGSMEPDPRWSSNQRKIHISVGLVMIACWWSRSLCVEWRMSHLNSIFHKCCKHVHHDRIPLFGCPAVKKYLWASNGSTESICIVITKQPLIYSLNDEKHGRSGVFAGWSDHTRLIWITLLVRVAWCGCSWF